MKEKRDAPREKRRDLNIKYFFIKKNSGFPQTSAHIEFVCGGDESPDPSNITWYLGWGCAYEVKFPTSLACK